MKKRAKFATLIIVLVLIISSSYFYYSGSKKEIKKESQLNIDQFLIKVLIKEGSNFTTQLKVMNVGDKGFSVKAEIKNLDFLSISKEEFYIDYGQTMTLDLKFAAKKGDLTKAPGLYSGKLVFVTDNERKEVPVIVAIESEDTLFSINLNMPFESRRLKKGSSGFASVNVYNLKKIGPANVLMSYYISDTNGNKIITESESAVIEDKTTFTKTITIPENILAGEYIYAVAAKYGSSTSVASNLFEIIEPPAEISFIDECVNKPYCLLSSLIILLLIISTVQYIYFTLEISQIGRVKAKNEKAKKEAKEVARTSAKIKSFLSIIVHGFYNYLASFYRILRRLRRLLALKIRESKKAIKKAIRMVGKNKTICFFASKWKWI